MIVGRGGMGMTKHGKSGKTPKSPRLRHRMRLEAERAQGAKKVQAAVYDSVQALMKHSRGR